MRRFTRLLPVLLVLTACGENAAKDERGAGSGASAGTGGSAATGGTAGNGAAGSAAGATLKVEGGTLRGATADGTRIFRGIPYATPPVGELRWKAPLPAAPWSGTRDATVFGAACPQNAAGDEDCLFLNVFAPDPAPAEPRPVMVWIHGGAFVFGSADLYDGSVLVEQNHVVVVTLNYRLGELGFFAYPDLAAEDPSGAFGNYAILDQRLALDWVQKNVAAFGGDPKNVTLFGESAGGISVCAQLASPGSAGKFHKAINESGPCNGLGSRRADAERHATELAAAVGCTDLACLRQKPASEIVGALGPTELVGNPEPWGPLDDGVILPLLPQEALESGAFNHVPIIDGGNRDEGTLFLGPRFSMSSDAEYDAALTEIGRVTGVANDRLVELRALYPRSDYDSAYHALSDAWGHAVFSCPARRQSRAFAKARVPTYRYFFTHAADTSPTGLGAYHSAEIPFVFGRAPLAQLSATVRGYWTHFAQTGDPNGASAVEWPRFDLPGEQYLELTTPAVARSDLLTKKCDFWDSLGCIAARVNCPK